MDSDSTTVVLKGDERPLNAALDRSHKNVSSWAGSAKKVIGVIGAALAVRGVVNFGSKLVQMADEQDKAERRLAAVLKATGNAAGFSEDQLKRVASQMQDNIGVSDSVILKTQAVIATFKNVRGEQFLEATKLAADMAEVLDGDLKSSAIQVSKALNDPTKGVTALADAGVSFTEKQREMIKKLQESGDMIGAQKIILEELRGEFGGAAEAAAEGFGGSINKLWLKAGELGERVGRLLVPALDWFGDVLSKGIDILDAVLPSLEDVERGFNSMASAIMEYVGPVFEWVGDLIVTMVSRAQVNLSNFQEFAQLAFTNFMLSAETAFQTVGHWLTVVIPDFLSWFADNWQEVLVDVANFTRVVFNNMWENVKGFFKGVWSWLNGGEADFEFKALTEGFESTIKELPEIAKRIPSELERSLQLESDALSSSLNKKYEEQIAKNRKSLESFFKKEAPKGIGDIEDAAKGISDEAEFALDTAKKAKDKLGEQEGLDKLFNRISAAALKDRAEIVKDTGSKAPEVSKTLSDATEKGAMSKEESLAVVNGLHTMTQNITGAIGLLIREIPNIGRMQTG